MADPDLDLLQTALKRRWSRGPSQKAKPYVHAFSAAERRGTKITAKVVGNHGTYTVSIQGDTQGVTSACSCYIGKHGHCHHCEALAITFLDDPSAFKIIKLKQAKEVHDLTDVRAYLDSVTWNHTRLRTDRCVVLLRNWLQGYEVFPWELSRFLPTYRVWY